MFTHSGMKAELRQVVSWGELPGVLQAESHSTGVTFWSGNESTKCTLCKPQWTIINLKTSDWESPIDGRWCKNRRQRDNKNLFEKNCVKKKQYRNKQLNLQPGMKTDLDIFSELLFLSSPWHKKRF